MNDKIPSKEECMELLKRYNVPENIVEHSIKVKEVALKIARALEKKGISIDEKLIVAASLLHDLDKVKTVGENITVHGKKASEELKKLGMHRVAEIVRKHVLEAILNGELKTLEEKIVYYADKRVLGNKVVSLKERFDYLIKRYGLKNKEMKKNIEKSYPKVVELEKELLGWTKKKLL